MILENIKLVNSPAKFVNRECDECKKSEYVRMSTVFAGRKKRKSNTDLCRKCSCSPKYRPSLFQLTMENGVNWKGGRSIDKGYSKIYAGNGKRVFEHVLIFEEHLGRKLIKPECVHHIDTDKLNNSINNLYLCKNKSEHMYCHASMEDCGFQVFNKLIWFDASNNIYVLDEKPAYSKLDTISITHPVFTRKHRGNPYYYVRISQTPKRDRALHSFIAEKMMNRKLFSDEIVHHINGNTLDNSVNNLVVMDRSSHRKCHESLQHCVGKLVKMGLIKFTDGKYLPSTL